MIGGLLMAIIILVLVLSPKAQPGQTGVVVLPTASPVYSTYFLGAILMATLMALSTVCACAGLAHATLATVTQARSVD